MRKVVAVFLALLVFLSFAPTAVLAVDKTITNTSATTVATTPIDYALPYPGLLPDSPVYFLKVARDKVISFLIASPTNKAFYTLLLSDKRLAAGQILIDTGKSSLGVITIVNGEEYFSEAVDEAAAAKKAGTDTSEVLAKLSVAAVKHQEIISNEMSKVSKTDQTDLNKAYSDSQNSQSRVQDLMKTSN